MSKTLDELRRERLEAEIRLRGAEADLAETKLAADRREESLASNMPSMNGTLTFFGAVNRENITKSMIQLQAFANANPGAPITVLINSEGGDIVSGFGFHDFLRHLSGAGHHITTKVVGGAMSMAVPIAQAGDTRLITPHSWILIHEGKLSFDGAVTMGSSDLEQQRAIMDQLETKILDIVSAKSTKPRSYFARKWKNKEWMIDAEEAEKLGLVDRIEE